MSGPQRVPTEILKRRGSWLANTRKKEPKPCAQIPRPPKWLDKAARDVYKQIASELVAMGVGRSPDVNALCRYCRNWVRWKQADAFLQKYGETYTLFCKDKGEGAAKTISCIMPFPQVSIVNKLEVSLSRLEQQFGLTPAARAKIQVEVPVVEKPESKDRFFKVG
jgi:P27 family predicted phage terminase small subunit